MKRLISILLISLIPSSIFAIGGLGLNLSQGSFSVDASYPKTDIPGVTLMNGAFDGSFGFGGYAYIDLIPFVDIEFEANTQGNLYDIEFQNAFGEMPPLEFAWVSLNTYTTVRKKVVGLSIPFLAGAQLHAGPGINTHRTVPIANIEMVTELLGGDLLNADPNNLSLLVNKLSVCLPLIFILFFFCTFTSVASVFSYRRESFCFMIVIFTSKVDTFLLSRFT